MRLAGSGRQVLMVMVGAVLSLLMMIVVFVVLLMLLLVSLAIMRMLCVPACVVSVKLLWNLAFSVSMNNVRFLVVPLGKVILT